MDTNSAAKSPALPAWPRTDRRFGFVRWLLALLALAQAASAQIGNPAQNRAPAGLWVGEVTLNAVATLVAPSDAVPTSDTAGFRLLVHVGADGTTQLLKDATIATVTDGKVQRTVLATDAKAPRIQPVVADGKPLLRRFGTVAYDWDGTGTEAHRKRMKGNLGKSSTCAVSLTSSPANATNPFRHPYHPDHQQGLTFIRTVAITLPAADPADPNNDGVLSLTGTYEEYVRGILPLNDPARPTRPPEIRVKGTVVLRRVSDIAIIDDFPAS